ncbi:MAG TPA: bifunctional folylpolyglutamate synthase/dihydrofolate synthase [Lentisphaeria bacterium]|nr:MAG: hypothetical protein A2X48_06855 [Lentisphaerae bacterium GWF2_49_21]HBC87467.1 bifunctional folylpolyglutamate synthase/dihydrofolate synthase [Lentisphaeria bacterium]
MTMPAYQDSLKFLSDLEIYGIKLGLEQVSELFSRTGNPQEKLRFIHVAGTNGKGSVCAMLSSCLKAAGLKTGFYSSPHLVSIRERFRINGAAIPEKELCRLIDMIRPHVLEMKASGRCPTFFEVTTVIAGMYFAEQKTDFVVWETGMGGRFDATNIVTPVASVITGIGIDHTAFLGSTLEAIAFEKAGIIKPGIPVFCGKLGRHAMKVIEDKARTCNSPIIYPEGNLKGIKLSLRGKIQKQNACLALAVLKRVAKDFNFDLKDSIKGFSNTVWPARFQILKDGSILDGSHNPQAVSVLISNLEEYFPEEKFTVIFGCLADKDSESIFKLLDKVADEFIFVPIKGSRKSLSPDELEQFCMKVSDKAARKAASVREALDMEHGKRFLITGSLYLAGQVLSEYFTEEEIVNI